MPVTINESVSIDFANRAGAFMQGLKDALPLVGEVARDEVIRTTLVGIGKGDAPFKPYSPSYQALIDAVGGKPGGVVNLRGIFVKKGAKQFRFKDAAREAKRQRRALTRGAGRRAYVQISAGGRSFVAMTQPTRPQMGLVDPQSEMSADLIDIRVSGDSVSLQYHPRQHDYMIGHNDTRPWFSLEKSAVKGAVAEALKHIFVALIHSFNN
jgi:hypothetical protein